MDRFSCYSYRLGIRNVQAKLESKKRHELEMDSGGSFSLSGHTDNDNCSGDLDTIQTGVFYLWNEEF